MMNAAKLTEREYAFLSNLWRELGISEDPIVAHVAGQVSVEELEELPKLLALQPEDESAQHPRWFLRISFGAEREIECVLPQTARSQEEMVSWVEGAFKNVLSLGHRAMQRSLPSLSNLYPPYSPKRRKLIEYLQAHFGNRVFTKEELLRAIEAYAQAPFDKNSLQWFLLFLKRTKVLRTTSAYSRHYQMVMGTATENSVSHFTQKPAAPTLKDMLERRRTLLLQIEEAQQALQDLEADIRRKAEEELGEDGLELLLQIMQT